MNAYRAQRIRFGILAARHMVERARLTEAQVEDLEQFVLSGWKYRDAKKAFDREHRRAELDELRRRWMRA